MSGTPELSVVVALISGRVDDLRGCLEALHRQSVDVDREILVPYDDAAAHVCELRDDFPDVEFVPAERSRTIVRRGGLVREHHDSLRSVGIKRARGRVVALTVDHAHVSTDWCAEMVNALDRYPEAGAVGGAIDCDSDSLVSWAVYFGDFGRYQSPVPEGRSEFVSDSNVAYRREALEQAVGGGSEDYHETILHGALTREGWQLVTTPRVRAWQRRGRLPVGPSLLERFVWGKSYAGGRCHDTSLAKRLVFAIGAPLIPILFSWRGWRSASDRGRSARFLAALPCFLLLQCFWAAGELAGYVTGRQ